MPGVPGRHVTFLVSPRNVTQRRRPDVRALRCAAGSLCFSKRAAAVELAACSRSNSPRRLPRTLLRCSALSTGASPWLRNDQRSSGKEKTKGLTAIPGFRFTSSELQKNTCPANRSGIASQPCLQTNTSAAFSPTKNNESY